MAEKRVIDWEGIEREYIPNLRSLRDIASQFGIDEKSIRKRAAANGWVRDLDGKIKSKADNIVRKEEVRKASPQKTSAITEKEIIDTTANIQATITLKHREKISKHQSLCDKLLEELIDQTVSPDELKQLGELMIDPELNFDKLNATYHKVISTPSRIDSMKKLSETAKTLVGLERQVYGIADNANGDADKKNSAFSMTIDDIQREREAINARRSVR